MALNDGPTRMNVCVVSVRSLVVGVIHERCTAVTGANSAGRRCTARAALAITTASRAAATTPAWLISLVAAHPQLPCTSTRTPTPYNSLSLTVWTCRSRAATNWRR